MILDRACWGKEKILSTLWLKQLLVPRVFFPYWASLTKQATLAGVSRYRMELTATLQTYIPSSSFWNFALYQSSAIKICSFCWRRIRQMIFFPGSEIPVPSLHGFETIPWGRAHRHHHCKGRSECRELQKRARCFVQHVQRLVVKKFLLFFLSSYCSKVTNSRRFYFAEENSMWPPTGPPKRFGYMVLELVLDWVFLGPK